MNFFEHQDRARRHTGRLVVLFVLAVLAIIAVVNLLVLGLLVQDQPAPGREPQAPLSPDFLARHLDVILFVSLMVGGLIGLASLVRTQQLRAGGGAIARKLGGTPVEPETRDPLRRRLRNVVEEVAIASGVPVPEIYVLEQEAGVNAFAAGYSPSDAAVAVTRGTLETLNRDELQGVVAHEFAHIFNGDMRLNIRLIGVLFGILALTIVGRMLLHSAGRSRSREAGAIVAVGIAIMLIGYIGVFFGRWIKASVSRQREYLADASAVQFTRQPEGIGGALKKIAAAQKGSRIEADTEEVAHMLFARGLAGRLFATHPPILERIRAIDPSFKEQELERIHKAMVRHQQARLAEREQQEDEKVQRPPGIAARLTDPQAVIERIGQPGTVELLAAAFMVHALPRVFEQAAHSGEWAMELVCMLLLSDDDQTRAAQLTSIEKRLGEESARQVRALWQADAELAPEQRLPLLEMAFPLLRRRPEPEQEELLALIEELIHADGRVDAFEYSLARLLRKQLEEHRHPERSAPSGKRRLKNCMTQVNDLLRIVAHHGHENEENAVAALSAGLKVLGASPDDTHPLRDNWHERLDAALDTLDGLRMADKEKLLKALITTVRHAGGVVTAEAELLRVISACLHIPLPPLTQQGATS